MRAKRNPLIVVLPQVDFRIRGLVLLLANSGCFWKVLESIAMAAARQLQKL